MDKQVRLLALSAEVPVFSPVIDFVSFDTS